MKNETYKMIQKDIDRVCFELETNIRTRQMFCEAQRAIWDQLRARLSSEHKTEMEEVNKKIGQATYEIDSSIYELKKYFVVHRAFDIAIAYLSQEIARCEALIGWANAVWDDFINGKCSLITSAGERCTLSSPQPVQEQFHQIFMSYADKKAARKERLENLLQELQMRSTGEDYSDFVKDDSRLNPNIPGVRIEMPHGTNIRKEFDEYLRNSGVMERKEEELKAKEAKPITFISNFSRYHSFHFTPQNDFDKVNSNYVYRKNFPNISTNSFHWNKYVFSFLRDDGVDKCREVIDTGSDNVSRDVLQLSTNSNVLVIGDKDTTGFENNKYLNKFLNTLILSNIDCTPIDKMSIHLVDSFSSSIFYTYSQSFSTLSKFESESIFKSHSSLGEVISFIDKKSNECMTELFNSDIQNMIELSRVDASKCFLHYVVIRNISSSECTLDNLEKLYQMVQDDSPAYKSGFRFIVCLNRESFSDPKSNELIDKIAMSVGAHYLLKNENDLFIHYESPRYNSYNPKNYVTAYNMVDTLIVEGDIQKIIYDKCSKAAIKFKELSTVVINYEALQKGEIVDPKDKKLTIPVGFSGNEKVYVDFDCGGGGNIGLMCVGQSGYGKSTLFTTIVISGCLKYSQNDLNFWLLDFKNNAAAGPFVSFDQKIPHVKLIAHDNTPNDGLTLLSILYSELVNRSKLLEELSSETHLKIDDIVVYNSIIDEKYKGNPKYKHLPRIILMIDEVQELFRDNDDYLELVNKISDLINQISSKGRFVGIHLAMFGQNFESAKADRLHTCFTNQIRCKIAFRLNEQSLAQAYFGTSFNDRSNEIANLRKGQAIINTESGVLNTTIAFASNPYLYISKIISLNHDSKAFTLTIGNKEKLNYYDKVARKNGLSYLDEIKNPRLANDVFGIAIGEDSYSLYPQYIRFTKEQNSSCVLLGDDKTISSSILTSLLIGIHSMNYEFNIISDLRKGNTLFDDIIKNNLFRDNTMDVSEVEHAIRNFYNSFISFKNSYRNNASPKFLLF